jgi:hypothetical protein
LYSEYLTYLKLSAGEISSNTLIEILNLRQLKVLNMFVSLTEDKQAYPYFSLNNTITDLTLCLNYEHPSQRDNLMKNIVQNKTIRRLNIQDDTDILQTTDENILTRLKSLNIRNFDGTFADRLKNDAVNLTELYGVMIWITEFCKSY